MSFDSISDVDSNRKIFPSVFVADVCSVGDGAHSKVSRVPHGLPYLTSKNIGQGILKLNDFDRISEDDFDRLFPKNSKSTRRAMEGDVLIGIIGTFGNAYLYTDGDNFGVASSVGILRPDQQKLFPKFLYYVITSEKFKTIHANHNAGSAQGYTNIPTIKKLRLPLPPLSEQKQIAGLLGTLDDRIALLRDTNATLEAIAQALFKSWFVDFDPVRAKQEGRVPEGMDDATAMLFPAHFQESLFGPIPQGWGITTLDKIAHVMMGLSPKGDSYNSEGVGVPLINGPVEFGDYFPVKTKWTQAATRLASEGDLIFCVRGSTTGRRVISDGEYCIGRGVCAIQAKDGFSNFVYQTINVGLDRLLEKATGSVFPSLSAPDIKSFRVLKPGAKFVESFERVTKPLIRQVQENHRQAKTLTTIRDTLLPRLISGQLRLPEAEGMLEEAAA